MALAKKSAPAKKPAPKPAAKAPSKPAAKPAAPAKAAVKPATAPAGKASLGKAPAIPGKPGGVTPASSGAKVHAVDEEAPVVVPKFKLEKHAGRDTLCQIEIVKEGHFFIARTQTDTGQAKEYKNTVFEDLLTEMVITLQEQLSDK